MREEIVYATRNIHFLRTKAPRVIQESLGLLKGIKGEKRIVDLGCGDGVILEVLQRTKELPKDASFIGIDSSEICCRTAKNNIPSATFIAGLGENIPLINHGY